ncbi:MAG: ABC transporter substrate-binding protein, partial [Limnochordia bacterium]|nr:ABC transporter substrate-binding protein [Limnochordia bacterium]
ARTGRFETDVFGTLHGDFPALLAEGIPMELPDPQSLPGRTFIEELVKLGQVDGQQIYVPWTQATYLMAANKKALDYLPEGADVGALTYAELLEWAKNLYEATGSAKLGLPAGPQGLFGRMLHGYLYPAFTGHQVQKFDSPDAVSMWSYLKELWDYVHPSSAIYENMADPLLLEEVWVAWDHTARLGPAIREFPDNFVLFPSPAGPYGRAFITVINGLGIPKGVQDFDLAWRLIDHLTHPETQVIVLEGTGFFPTTVEAASYVPQGANKLLADAVAAQASAPDALVSLLPVGLGARDGEYVPTFKDAFEAIVLRGQDIETVLARQGARLRELFEDTGADYPQP